MAGLRHAAAVVAGYTLLFAWMFAYAPATGAYLTESDLYEYYLPIFLAPITAWSPYEFSGLPAFADPGDFSLYPPHYIARLLGSWTGLVTSAFVLASSLMYALIHYLTRSWRAAAFAGLAYGLSETMLERIPHLGTVHAFVWLPLILLAIERLCDKRRGLWVSIGAAAMACAILAGHPQPAIYTAYAALIYALLAGRSTRQPLAYYAAVAGMFALSGLIAAVKLLPLVEASTLMARQFVSFSQFAAHGNSPAQTLSLLYPVVLHEGREAPTYVGLVALVLAFIGGARVREDWRAAYCVVTALFALLIGMGDATPLARIAYTVVPLYDNFRVAARHLFLFAFGSAALAGFAIAALERGEVAAHVRRRALLAMLGLIGAGAALLAIWPDTFPLEARAPLSGTLPLWHQGIWVQFAVALASGAALLAFCRRPGVLTAMICGVVLVADTLHALPYGISPQGVKHVTMPMGEADPSVHALQLGRELAPLQQRAFATGGTGRDAVLPAAFARVWRIPIAGGYGPMLLDRYSRLAMMGTSGQVNPTLFASEDAALDLLSVRTLMIRADELAEPPAFERDGIRWNAQRLSLPVGRPECGHTYARRISIPLPRDIDVARVAIVAHLGCSEDVPQGTAVATVRVVGENEPLATLPLHAGREIAETALAIDAVRARAKHLLIARFDDPDVGDGYVYRTDVVLPSPARARRLEIEGAATGGWVTIDRVTVVDAANGSHPLALPGMWFSDPERWQRLRTIRTRRGTDRDRDSDAPDEAEVRIVENKRALPRAWVVDEVVSLTDHDAVETVRRSQLPDGRPFDPRRTAIVDDQNTPLRTTFSPGARDVAVRHAHDRRMTIDVATEGGGFLVVSDVWYPGWRARIDGERVPVYRADVALRGIVLPPGRHTVEFELVSVTMLVGAALSVAAIGVAVALAVGVRPRRVRSPHRSRTT